jgi:hypothetical protein
MKTCNRLYPAFGKLLAVAATCLAIQNIHAQLLFSEGFDYTSGTGLANKVNPGNSTAWTGGNNSELQIGSSQLSYTSTPGLQQAAGNDLVYTSSGSSSTSYNTYSAVTGSGNSIYFSFLIDCTAVPTANEYIMALNPGTTAPGGSSDAMATYVGASGVGGFKIGVRNGNSGASYTSTLTLGTTYFIVEELTLGTTPTVSLFLDPIPGASQPTATATQTGTVAATSVDDIGFKVQSVTTTGDFDIDDLLVGTTYASVTPEVTPEPSTLALAGIGLLGLAMRFRRARA